MRTTKIVILFTNTGQFESDLWLLMIEILAYFIEYKPIALIETDSSLNFNLEKNDSYDNFYVTLMGKPQGCLASNHALKLLLLPIMVLK